MVGTSEPCRPSTTIRQATSYLGDVDRLAANGLEPRLRGGVAEVVRRLCGVQAQDARAARLAIRARTEGLVASDVDAEAAVVRTWAWRGTLHLLAREDVPWVLSLVAPRANAAVAGRRRGAGLRPPPPARGPPPPLAGP